ncbi:holin family protein [Pararhodobacter sp.]|uniref:holin family protein n=1 Tax=Pararhodobacter sp. TaxID=2127056 RepID=UPI002AFFF66E|nr:holin family protein [Pararhodobacter sp.]
MGLIAQFFRALFLRGGLAELGRAGTQVIDAVRPNATRQLQLGHDAFTAVQAEHAEEFRNARGGYFDAFVNGLNRLPRPMLAIGTLSLFIYSMADPAGFSVRMRGLAEVPEPLWWLLGAVVAFYFGARETHHLRAHRPVSPRRVTEDATPAEPRPPENPALAEWRRQNVDTDIDRS